VRSGATYAQPLGCLQAAWREQIEPLPQSCRIAGFMHLPVLAQIRPSAQRVLPHIGPVSGGPPVHAPLSPHFAFGGGHIVPLVQST
jgi:hypothetical protein